MVFLTAVLLLSTLLRGHHAGQFCWIQIPAVNAFEWHPFTISSSPYSSLGEGGSVCFRWFFILYVRFYIYDIFLTLSILLFDMCLSAYLSTFLHFFVWAFLKTPSSYRISPTRTFAHQQCWSDEERSLFYWDTSEHFIWLFLHL